MRRDITPTPFVSFHHQLVNRCQLSVVKAAHLLRLDIRHVHRACVLEVLECLRDEQAYHLQICRLNGIENLQSFGSAMPDQLDCPRLHASVLSERNTYCGKACRKNELTPAQLRCSFRSLFGSRIAATCRKGASSTTETEVRRMIVKARAGLC